MSYDPTQDPLFADLGAPDEEPPETRLAGGFSGGGGYSPAEDPLFADVEPPEPPPHEEPSLGRKVGAFASRIGGPLIGSAVGGAIGTALGGPPGTVAGAMLGAGLLGAGGEVGAEKILGEDVDPLEVGLAGGLSMLPAGPIGRQLARPGLGFAARAALHAGEGATQGLLGETARAGLKQHRLPTVEELGAGAAGGAVLGAALGTGLEHLPGLHPPPQEQPVDPILKAGQAVTPPGVKPPEAPPPFVPPEEPTPDLGAPPQPLDQYIGPEPPEPPPPTGYEPPVDILAERDFLTPDPEAAVNAYMAQSARRYLQERRPPAPTPRSPEEVAADLAAANAPPEPEPPPDVWNGPEMPLPRRLEDAQQDLQDLQTERAIEDATMAATSQGGPPRLAGQAPVALSPAAQAAAEGPVPRAEERRADVLPVAEDRRGAERRAVAERLELPPDHPAVQEVLALTSEARTDPLTGLANKRGWQEIASTVHPENDHVAAIDLKGFKPVNDRYGHAAGDVVLQRVGDLVRQHFGDEGARPGGDEFNAVLRGVSPEEAQAKVEAFREDLRAARVQLRHPQTGETVDIPGMEAHIGLERNAEAADLASNLERERTGSGRVAPPAEPAPASPGGPVEGAPGLPEPRVRGREAELAAPPEEADYQTRPYYRPDLRDLESRTVEMPAVREEEPPPAAAQPAPAAVAPPPAAARPPIRLRSIEDARQVRDGFRLTAEGLREQIAHARSLPDPARRVERAASVIRMAEDELGRIDAIKTTKYKVMVEQARQRLKALMAQARAVSTAARRSAGELEPAPKRADVLERARTKPPNERGEFDRRLLGDTGEAKDEVDGYLLQVAPQLYAQGKPRDPLGQDPLARVEASGKDMAVAIARDADNPLYQEMHEKYAAAVEEHRGGRAAPDDEDISFNPEELEGPGAPKYATRPAPGQRGLEGIGQDVPQREERRPGPAQQNLFGGEMLQGTEARTTEGREREGALFTQDAEARARKERESQGGLFKEPAPYRPPAPAAQELPPRTADTMSEAIALSSPSGEMSQRAKDAATARLSEKLFGPGGLQRESTPQPDEVTRLQQQAARLRDLADRGMSSKKYNAEAARLEAEAARMAAAKPQGLFAAEESAPQRGIADFGEKIGGARKDLARPLGQRVARPAEERPEGPAWRRQYSIGQIAKSTTPGEEGRWSITRRGEDIHESAYGRRKTFATKEEAEAAIPLIELAKTHAVYPSRPTGGEAPTWQIVRKLGERRRPVVKGGFESEEAAKRYMVQHADEVLSYKFPMPDKPWLDHIERQGPEYRKGDVAPVQFQQTFGFRGGEFGNWNMGSDGQASLNHAYDALMDLSRALGVPPKALSLDGELAIAFGARGHGGKDSARAHYEPDLAVINLTKIKGAGSLAHEWFHALDHYLSKQAHGGTYQGQLTTLSRGFPYTAKTRPELQAAFERVMREITSTERTSTADAEAVGKMADRMAEGTSRVLQNIRQQFTYAPYNKRQRTPTPEELARFDAIAERIKDGDVGPRRTIDVPGYRGGVRALGRSSYDPIEELNNLYKSVRGRSFATADENSYGRQLAAQVDSMLVARKRLEAARAGTPETKRGASDYLRNSRNIDQYRASDYWSTPHEMAARAFESYAFDKLQGGAQRSDYLTSGVENKFYALLGMKPYPEGAERAKMNAAFEDLFQAVKTRETERGVQMYRASSEAPLEGVTRDHVKRAFAAGDVREVGQGAWDVSLPGDRKVRVRVRHDGIEYNPEAFKAGYERELGPGEEIVGAWQKVDKGGLVWLAKQADQGTVHHEAFHAGMDLALSPKERAAVVKHYGSEEAAAEAYAKWQPARQVNSWFSRIAQFFRRVYRTLSPTWESAFERVRSGEAYGKPHPETGRKYSSTQVELPPEIGRKLKALAARIPEGDLSTDPNGAGREANPHVTVKFGLETDDVDRVRQLLAGEPPIAVRMGKTTIFPAKEGANYDVLKADVESPDLHRLNAKIKAALPTTDTHPEYVPHATLAYLKPGLGKKYAGDTSLSGLSTTIDHITFSTRGGKEVEIPLGGQGGPDYATAAFHGSPHDFDKFDLGKVGTGEGAQAYGHGLYFAGKKAVADWYRTRLAGGDKGPSLIINGKDFHDMWAGGFADEATRRAAQEVQIRTSYYNPERVDPIKEVRGQIEKTVENLRDDLTTGHVPEDYLRSQGVAPNESGIREAIEFFENTLAFLDNNDVRFSPRKRSGRMYEVELQPDEDEYLQWDKPLREQSPKVREKLAAAGFLTGPSRFSDAQVYARAKNYFEGPRAQADAAEDIGMREHIRDAYRAYQKGPRAFREWADTQMPGSWTLQRMLGPKAAEEIGRGSDFYERLSTGHQKGSPEKASQFLREIGIPGIKYKDSFSRGGSADGEGTYNYVLFDDSLVKTTAKYATAPKMPPQMPSRPPGAPPAATGAPQQQPAKSFSIPEETALQKIQRVIQDKFNRVSTVQGAIAGQGGKISEPTDVAAAIDAFGSKTAHALEDVDRSYVTPLVQGLAKDRVGLEDLGDYMSLLHAPERDAYVARITDGANTSGSGWKPADANARWRELEQKYGARQGGRIRALEPHADIVRQMREAQVDTLLDGGLISKDQADAWRNDMPDYVPLRHHETNEGLGTGQGFDIRGREAKQITGRSTKAENPITFMLQQYQKAIVRAEKNKVDQRLAKLVEDNPDNALWEVDADHVRREVGPDGKVRTVRDQRAEADDLAFKIDGGQHRITLRDPLLKRAMENMSAKETGEFVRKVGAVTRAYSRAVTTFSPEFLFTNFARDAQEAIANLGAEHGAEVAKDAAKRVVPSMRAMWRVLKDPNAQGKLEQYAREFRKDGGAIGFYHIDDIPALEKSLQGRLSAAGPGALPAARRAIGSMSNWVQRANESVENGTRLASYIALREAGASRQKAAEAARNVTVNFTKKGEAGPAVNALYAFFNANVQGTKRLVDVLRSKRGAALGASIAGLGAAMDAYNRSIAGDSNDDGTNDYDDIPDYVKQHNLVFMRGEGKTPLLFPMPYGYAMLHNAGRQLMGVTSGAVTPGKAAASLGSAAWNAFNPLGGEADLVQTLTPTALDPIVQDVMNKDFTGRAIRPDKYPGEAKPPSEQYFRSVPPTARALAKWLNETSGGDSVTPGYVSVSPETLDHYWSAFSPFLVGGYGRFGSRVASTATSLAEGETPSIRNMPVVHRFAYEESKGLAGSKYHDNREQLEETMDRYRTYKKEGNRDGLRSLPMGLLRAKPQLDAIDRAIVKLRKYPPGAARDRKIEELESRANKVYTETSAGAE